MDYLDRLARLRTEGNGSGHPDDGEAKKLYPFLWELLTTKICLQQKVKIPARMQIQAGMGEWSVTLTDESLAMSISTVSSTLRDAFQALETALASGQGWNEWRKREPKLRKLPKKSED